MNHRTGGAPETEIMPGHWRGEPQRKRPRLTIENCLLRTFLPPLIVHPHLERIAKAVAVRLRRGHFVEHQPGTCRVSWVGVGEGRRQYCRSLAHVPSTAGRARCTHPHERGAYRPEHWSCIRASSTSGRARLHWSRACSILMISAQLRVSASRGTCTAIRHGTPIFVLSTYSQRNYQR
jgi:hypothetical protein